MDTEDLHHIVLENNRMLKEQGRLLHKVYKYQQFQKISKIVYFVFLVALALGAYYYAKPYIDTIQSSYNSFMQGFTEVKGVFGNF